MDRREIAPVLIEGGIEKLQRLPEFPARGGDPGQEQEAVTLRGVVPGGFVKPVVRLLQLALIPEREREVEERLAVVGVGILRQQPFGGDAKRALRSGQIAPFQLS